MTMIWMICKKRLNSKLHVIKYPHALHTLHTSSTNDVTSIFHIRGNCRRYDSTETALMTIILWIHQGSVFVLIWSNLRCGRIDMTEIITKRLSIEFEIRWNVVSGPGAMFPLFSHGLSSSIWLWPLPKANVCTWKGFWSALEHDLPASVR